MIYWPATRGWRSEALRRAVAQVPCVYCGRQGRTQHAHSNLDMHGKGKGLKASDAAGMALCCEAPGEVGCHTLFDQKRLPLPPGLDWIDFTHVLIARTYIALAERGLLRPV